MSLSQQFEYRSQSDITLLYLRKVLEGKASKVGELASLFSEIQIDRVYQSFVDQIIENSFALDPKELIGMLKMAQATKRFLSNLNNISKIDTDTAEPDELLDDILATGISQDDINLATRGHK